MGQITGYTTIENEDINALTLEVIEEISIGGWQPLGGVVFGGGIWVQVLVMYM